MAFKGIPQDELLEGVSLDEKKEVENEEDSGKETVKKISERKEKN